MAAITGTLMSLVQQDEPEGFRFASCADQVLIWSVQGLQLLNGHLESFEGSDAWPPKGQAGNTNFEADVCARVGRGHVAAQVLRGLLKLCSNLARHPHGLPASFVLAFCRSMEAIYNLQVCLEPFGHIVRATPNPQVFFEISDSCSQSLKRSGSRAFGFHPTRWNVTSCSCHLIYYG